MSDYERAFLLKVKNGDSAFLIASKWGDTGIVKALIDDGININLTNEDGENALIIATKNGQTEVVEILIEAGALH